MEMECNESGMMKNNLKIIFDENSSRIEIKKKLLNSIELFNLSNKTK